MTTHRPKHVMISYQWDHQELVKRIFEYLQSHQSWKIWMDIHGGMGSSLAASMAEGVQNSAALVCFLSEAYQNSVNCKKELTYAMQLKKPIIPCLLPTQDNIRWTPSDWLGLTIADILYLNFTDINDDNFEEKCDQLIEKIYSLVGDAPTSSAGEDEDDEE